MGNGNHDSKDNLKSGGVMRNVNVLICLGTQAQSPNFIAYHRASEHFVGKTTNK